MSRLARARAVAVLLVAGSAILGLAVANGSLAPPAIPGFAGPSWTSVALGCGLVVFRGLTARILGVLAMLTALWGAILCVAVSSAGRVAVAGAADSQRPSFAAVTLGLLAMAALACAGVMAFVGAGHWGRLAGRYGRAGERHLTNDAGPVAMWDALDRGEDPTDGGRSGLMAP